MKNAGFWVVLLLLTVFIATPALADDDDDDNDEGLNVQLFRPSIFGGSFISFEDGRTISGPGFHIGALVNYTNSLLTDYEDDEPNFDYISELYTANLMLAFGIVDWLNIGVDVPLHYVRHRVVEDVNDPASASDLAVSYTHLRAHET